MTEEFEDWQPVRIAPEKEILKYHPFTSFGKFAGRVIRVRVYVGNVEFDLGNRTAVGLPPCGARQTYVVHPEDAMFLSGGERDFVAVCEHQIQAD
jgi:hypothetical protein